MDYRDYQERVLARNSHRWHNELIPLATLKIILHNFITWGNELDRVKKSLLYNRPFQPVGTTYPVSSKPIPVPEDRDQLIIHAMLGAATETVEMMEALWDYLSSDNPSFDLINLQEEFGDLEWYRALGLHALGQTDEENRDQNDAKLESRYGGTFTEDAANNVDRATERRVLEEKGN